MTRAVFNGEIRQAVENLIDYHVENDPTVNAYMIAASAFDAVKQIRGGITRLYSPTASPTNLS